MSHLPAIFLQQAISGSDICRKSAAQAIAGSNVQANRTTAASQRAEILVTTTLYALPKCVRNSSGTELPKSAADIGAAQFLLHFPVPRSSIGVSGRIGLGKTCNKRPDHGFSQSLVFKTKQSIGP